MTYEEELQQLHNLILKQQDLETKLKDLEKKVSTNTTDINKLKEDSYKQMEEIKTMFGELTKEIKELNNRLVKTETINELQEEKIKGNLDFITGQNSIMFKYIIYLSGFGLGGLFGFKIVEFIQSLF